MKYKVYYSIYLLPLGFKLLLLKAVKQTMQVVLELYILLVFLGKGTLPPGNTTKAS